TLPVAIDAQGRVCDLGANVSSGQLLEYTGAYIFEPQVLQYIPPRTYVDAYSQLIPTLLAAGIIVAGYQMAGYWSSLDSFHSHQEAQKVFLHTGCNSGRAHAEASGAQRPRVRYPSTEGHQIAPRIWVGPNHIMHPSARLAPPSCIGEGCRIGYAV